MNRCPHCHQIIPPEIAFRGRMERAVYDAVKARPTGISMEALIDACYGDDPNGGPLEAAKVIAVRINQMNKRVLVSYGLKIRSSTRSSTYKLHPVSTTLTREQILWHEAAAVAFSAGALYPSGTSGS